MSDRGVIKNREFALQIRDFSGLQFGKITPTDIDGYIDYRGRCQVFIEAKHGSAELTFGQRLALERLVNNSTVPAVAFVIRHYTDGDIDFGTCELDRYYFDGEWREHSLYKTLRPAIAAFLVTFGGYKDE